MQSRTIFSIAVVAALLFPIGLTSISWAQDRDQDRLKTQDKLKDPDQDRDRLKTQDKLKDPDRIGYEPRIKTESVARSDQNARTLRSLRSRRGLNGLSVAWVGNGVVGVAVMAGEQEEVEQAGRIPTSTVSNVVHGQVHKEVPDEIQNDAIHRGRNSHAVAGRLYIHHIRPGSRP